jgi:hypothetical protein
MKQTTGAARERVGSTPSGTRRGRVRERWAELLARLRAAGRAMPVKDSLIAATALANGMTVVTRNVTDFEKAGCPVLDPLAGTRP